MLKKFLLVCCLSFFAASQLVAGVGVSTGNGSLTVEEIVNRNIAARGGADAWRKVISMTVAGKMDVGKGMQVPYTLELKRGRKVRLEIQFQGETAVQVFDGANGWKRRPFLGRKDVEPFTPEELQKASLDSDLDGPLVNHVSDGTRLELVETDKVDGRNAYKLKLTLKTGQIRCVWIDAETFLEAKVDGTRRMDGRQRTLETFYRDYRTVQGLKVPFVYETSVDGVKGTEKININNVAVNPTLDDTVFSKLR